MRRLFPLVALALLLPTAAPAQARPPEAGPLRLSLPEAIRRAMEGEEVRLARATVEEARAQVVTARADALPQVRTQLSYQRTFASPFQSSGSGPVVGPFAPDTTLPVDQRVRYLENNYDSTLIRGISGLFASTPFGRENAWTGGVTVSQLLFQGGKVGAGLAGARAYEDAAGAQLDETRQDIVARTRRAYLDALYAERLVAIAEDGRRLADEQLRRVELNQRVGSAAEYDLLRARVEAANQDPLVVSARNGRDLAYRALRQLVNVPSETPIELDPGPLTLTDTLIEVDTAELAALVASRRLVDAAEAAVELRRQAVRYYRGDYWPAFRANLYLGAQAYPNGFTPLGERWTRDWYASFTVSWPLFEGLRTRGQVQLAQAQLDRARLDLARTQEAVELEVEQARAELARARTLLDARRVTVTQAAQAHRLAGVRYANGISTQLEVSDARLALQQAEANEAAATRDYLVAIANMERALGRPVPMRMVERRASAEPASAAAGTRE
jgi:outer membrane protein TolC